MKEQKAYHTRKLAIIEMIEECDRCMDKAQYFINNLSYNDLTLKNGVKNFVRYVDLKIYLIERYNRQ